MSADLQRELDREELLLEAELCRRDMREFVKAAWQVVEPKPMEWGPRMDALCDHIGYVLTGEIKNLLVTMPPRHSKSTIFSVLAEPWSWLLDPKIQWLVSTYKYSLTVRDAQRSRRLMESQWWQNRFGHLFYLLPGSNEKQRYYNNLGGYRISTSHPDGSATGEGGDILLVDDPHNMADMESQAEVNAVLYWWDNAWRSRLNNARTGRRIVVGQRGGSDLIAHILRTEGADAWEELRLPLEYNPRRHTVTFSNPDGKGPDKSRQLFSDWRTEEGELLDKQRMGETERDSLLASMGREKFDSQYNQSPVTDEGRIFRRSWWRCWQYPAGHPQAGQCMDVDNDQMFAVISAYDTAYEEEDTSDPTARLTAGLFEGGRLPNGDPEVHVLLLEAINCRMGFPELRAEAKKFEKQMHPDVTLIERKASGISLIQELRRAGIPVRGIKVPPRSKVARAHSVTPMMEAGRVWYPPRMWAMEVVDQASAFPDPQAKDDLVDALVMILAYVRKRYDFMLASDEMDEDIWQVPRGRNSIYT